MNPSTISLLERRVRRAARPRGAAYETLIAIARVLHKDPTDLFPVRMPFDAIPGGRR